MDLDDDALQDGLIEAFQNLEHLPEISTLLYDILMELRLISGQMQAMLAKPGIN